MTRPARTAQENGFIFIPWFFRVFPWLIIKISIMWLTQHARQLLGALFVRRLRFRLVKNSNIISFY